MSETAKTDVQKTAAPVVDTKKPEVKALEEQKKQEKEQVTKDTREQVQDRLVNPMLKSVYDTLSSFMGAHPENFLGNMIASLEKFMKKLMGEKDGKNDTDASSKSDVQKVADTSNGKLPVSDALYRTVETSPDALGERMASVARKFLGMQYQYNARPDAKSAQEFYAGNRIGAPISESARGRYDGGGIDCGGLWWAVWREVGFVGKNGEKLSGPFFAGDGFRDMIPSLAKEGEYEEFNSIKGKKTPNDNLSVEQLTKIMEDDKRFPEGTLIAFRSHVGIKGKNGMINASGRGNRGSVVETPWRELFSYYKKVGPFYCNFRALSPKYIRTSPPKGPTSMTV